MKQSQLLEKLEELCRLPHETEWVEFKEAKTGKDFRQIGKYFSALSNEANLKNQPCGWLVFGVINKDHSICGSQFRMDPADLDSLKHEIAQQTGGITLLDIHVVNQRDGRVVMLQIPAAPQGAPVAFQGHWYGRDGESLVALSLSELETIREQVGREDWSACECTDASLAALDPQAIEAARANFSDKNSSKPFANESSDWSDEVFLDRARLTSNGRVTRAALLLLGRTESTHYLSPAVAQITWRLDSDEQAYEHFGPPFLLTTSEVYSRIRNTLQKIDVIGRLVPYEIPKYDKWVKVLDPSYTALLMQKHDLSLDRVILLDKIQKKRRIEKDEAGRLRREKLIEGRYPNLFVAAHLAAATGDEARYIRNRAFDDDHYKQMIVEYLKTYCQASRSDIDALLLEKLSDVLDARQKRSKIKNLLSALVKKGVIRNDGTNRRSKWVLI